MPIRCCALLPSKALQAGRQAFDNVTTLGVTSEASLVSHGRSQRPGDSHALSHRGWHVEDTLTWRPQDKVDSLSLEAQLRTYASHPVPQCGQWSTQNTSPTSSSVQTPRDHLGTPSFPTVAPRAALAPAACPVVTNHRNYHPRGAPPPTLCTPAGKRRSLGVQGPRHQRTHMGLGCKGRSWLGQKRRRGSLVGWSKGAARACR